MAEQSSLAPSSRKRGRNGTGRHFSPRDYADAVHVHSLSTINESLYPGHNYIELASLLLQPYQSYAPRVGSPSSHSEELAPRQPTKEFAALLEIRETSSAPNASAQNGCGQRSNISSLSAPLKYLQAIEDLEVDVDEHASVLSEQSHTTHGALLFLRGYAKPEWLNTVGARYSVDPEFFLRHLDLFLKSARSNYFTYPPLPSSSTSMLRLCITTIGRRLGEWKHNEALAQSDIHSLRRRAEKSLQSHIESVSRGSDDDLKLGDSMVRHFSVHDEEHFSLEQDVSVYVTKSGSGWIVVIWSDVGNDLAESLVGPWQDKSFSSDSWNINYLPTIQHVSRVALKARKGQRSLSQMSEGGFGSHSTTQRKIPQSASLIHLGYARKPDYSVMASDPFYALNDIFCFAACSESQIINLIEEKLRNEIDYAALDRRQYQDVSNILYHKQILKRHITYLDQIIAFIEARDSSDWPRSKDITLRTKADATTQDLLKKFRSLQERSKTLVGDCDAGMQVRMNNIQIKEAQSTLKQTKSTAKLTKLAFFYVPLSFTTSLFGMNVIEFGIQATIKLWQWILLSGVLLILSFVFLVLEWQDLRNTVFRWPRKGDIFGLVDISLKARGMS